MVLDTTGLTFRKYIDRGFPTDNRTCLFLCGKSGSGKSTLFTVWKDLLSLQSMDAKSLGSTVFTPEVQSKTGGFLFDEISDTMLQDLDAINRIKDFVGYSTTEM